MNFKFGIVSEAKSGFAKVLFMQDNITTDWLPIVFPYTMKDKVGYVLNVKEHVACLCDERCEEGVILGAIHSKPEPADAGANVNKFRKLFEDGTLLEYDKSTHILKADIKGKLIVLTTGNIEATAGGDVKVTATNIQATASVQIKAVAQSILIQGPTQIIGDVTVTGKITASGEVQGNSIKLSAHVHGGVSSGGSTTGNPQ